MTHAEQTLRDHGARLPVGSCAGCGELIATRAGLCDDCDLAAKEHRPAPLPRWQPTPSPAADVHTFAGLVMIGEELGADAVADAAAFVIVCAFCPELDPLNLHPVDVHPSGFPQHTLKDSAGSYETSNPAR